MFAHFGKPIAFGVGPKMAIFGHFCKIIAKNDHFRPRQKGMALLTPNKMDKNDHAFFVEKCNFPYTNKNGDFSTKKQKL